MKYLLILLFSALCVTSLGQTTPMSFTATTADHTDPNRGAQHWGTTNWDGTFVPLIPAGNRTPKNWYTRFNWTDIESTTTLGLYNWTIFDGFVNQAIDSGGMFSYGLMAFCSACGLPAFGYPTYVHNGMQAESAANHDWQHPNGFWVPNYGSVTWKTRYVALMHAVANHIATTSRNGIPFAKAWLGFDMRHFSDFGEGNGFDSGDFPTGAFAQITDAELIFYTDSAIGIHPNVQLTIPMSYVAPNNDYNNADGNTGTQAAYHVLTSSNAYGRIGWRRDNLGDDGYNAYITGTTATFNPGTGPVPLLPLLMNCYQVAPIGGEPANDLSGTSRCGSIQCDLHHEDTLFGISQFGNGNYPVTANSSPNGPILVTAMQAASKEQGYHLVFTGGSSTTAPVVNGAFNITLDWRNTGLAPVYEAWTVQYQLRTAAGVVKWTGNSHFTPRLFQKRFTDSVVVDGYTLTGLAAGTYNLVVVMLDPVGYKKPLQPYVTAVQSDGSVLLRTGVTVGSTGAPVANAGPTQTIALPTSSVTLDGSASSGTITTYAWTQLSGPNSASLGTPANVTTPATGLIQGAYVFQLSVNSGVSTSTVTINVNPAPPTVSNVFTTQTPASQGGPDPTGSVELGMKFRSTVPGFITGVRFYKTSIYTGVHIGQLYSYPAGALLASATFTGETASGWQSVTFASPVAITANTTYVVAYFNTTSIYTSDNTGFASAIVNGNLTGLANGTDGGNGVFNYGTSPLYPNQTFQQSNYFVDVNFTTVGANVSFIIGTGSGAVSLTSMTGHQPGDTALIATQTGVYTSLTLKALDSIIVLPQSGRPTFTTTSTFCNLVHMNVGFINFVSTTGGTGISETCGTIDSSRFHNFFMQGWTTAFDHSGNTPYTPGNNLTYKHDDVIYDSITLNQCGRPFQGSFGVQPITNVDVDHKVTINRLYALGTTTTSFEGVVYTGVCFNCAYTNSTVISTTQRGASGDVGELSGSGYWYAKGDVMIGGPGYLFRIFPMMELSDTGSNYMIGCRKTDGTEYGMQDLQFFATDTVAGQRRGTGGFSFNNTMGNQFNDTLGFWSPMFNNGQVPPNCHYYTYNNFAFNVGNNTQKVSAGGLPNNGKPQMAYNNGGWTTNALDTGHNYVAKYATNAFIDSVTILLTNSLGSFPRYQLTALSPSALLHGGITNPFATVDYLGNPLRVPPDLGYIQLINGGVPPAPNYLPGLRKGIPKRFRTLN